MTIKLVIRLACLLGFLVSLHAQITTTTLVGTVSDATGAVLVGAQVSATNTGTNLRHSATTNAQGGYRIEFLPVGEYAIEVRAAGFKTFVQKGVRLEIDQTARVDASLVVGSTGETVEVTAAVPIVNTANPELGRTVENEEIVDLPIVNRNLYTLLDLTPGVQRNENTIVLGYPEQRTLINGGVDGGAGSVNYYLDGGINMTSLRNTGNVLPNPDAIQEFRVQTNNYNAEYGRFASGVVNVITKSGTNTFHGSAFEFVRNTMLNANTWGNTITDTPPLHRNQFGVTFGGPIMKNKTFFFASYSGLRQSTSAFLTGAIVPTALERSGDFSQSAVKPVNPVTHTAFPSNKITSPDPVAMQIINQFIPAANVGANKWQGFIPSPYNTDEFLGKIDHSIGEAHRLTATYFETSGTNTIVPGTTPAGVANNQLPWSQQEFDWRQHEVNLSDTWSIGPTKINQVWLTFTRNFGSRLNVPQTSLASLGSLQTVQGTPSLSQITVTSFFTLAQAIAGPVAGTNFYSARDTFSYNRGRHAFKFGGELSLDKDIQQTLLNNYGVFTFNGLVSKNALADFELGLPSSLSQDAPVTSYTNTWYTAVFAQDDFRIHPRLTLNLGVRWDIQTPPTDPQDKESTFVRGVQSTVRPGAPAGILFPGDAGITRGIVSTPWNHVSPRVGLAWDPFGDGRTSVRAGAGIFYGSVSGNQWNTTSNFEPFAIRLNFTNNNSATKSTGATLSNPYRNLTGGDPFPYAGQFVPGGSIFGASPNFHWPYTYQLNFSVQRQVTANLGVTAAYVGSLSHDLPFAVDLNYPLPSTAAVPVPSTTNAQARRPNPNFGAILSMQSGQTASYHGLQISATQRMSHHLSFNAFYIYSKTFDSVQLQNNTTQALVQDFTNMAADRGRADTDMRHQLLVSLTWQPDYYQGGNLWLRNLGNGWSVSPILKIHSGFPFTVLNGADANLDGNMTTDRARLLGDPMSGNCLNPDGTPGPAVGAAACWFNNTAFVRNAPTTGAPVDGNSPRNFLDQPAYKDVDLAIFRKFKLSERFNMEFRGEALNVFNMVSLNAPNATAPTDPTKPGNFGMITSAQTMRQLQLGLRLTY